MTDRVLVPGAVATLWPWVTAGVLGPAEVHGAAAIVASAPAPPDPAVVLGAAFALWAPGHGHACVDLTGVALDAAVATARRTLGEHDVTPEVGGATAEPLPWPDPVRWQEALRASPLVREVAGPDRGPVYDDRPLVLAGLRLYTQRQWIDECIVAAFLHARTARAATDAPGDAVAALDSLLPPVDAGPDLQHAAALAAMTGALTVIVGGPGTGKTFTIGCLLVAALAAEPGLRVGLAAPTGKAAARLTESVERLVPAPGLRATTIHRLLGPRPDHRTRFTHHRGALLPYDMVVVDETSMVPLPLMARLVEALPDSCRLVLVGDPDQLESVEVGAVLADLVRAADLPDSPLHDRVVRLEQQRRTAGESLIGPLRDAVRDEQVDTAIELLRSAAPGSSVSFVPVLDGAADLTDAATAVHATLAGPLRDAVAAAERGDGAAALDSLDAVRILCAHRRGPYGVESWNGEVERWLLGTSQGHHEYAGRALLATRNDARTGTANGDTGITVNLPVDGSPRLRAVFRRGGGVVAFAPAELDELETAFAMTVHKSQGSEYDTVVVVHPPADSPLVGRELLYTALTRARRRLVVIGSEESLRRAVATPARRVTGLSDALVELARDG